MSRKNQFLLLIAVAIFSFTLFLATAYVQLGNFGFPLDDGWIHQTYARNFAERGEWAYIPGQTSGGSTSPLWTVILSLVYLTRTGPFLGTFIISGLLFFGSGFLFQQLFEKSTINRSDFSWIKGVPVFGLFFLLEWRMNWAAVSGMELMLYIFVILAFFLALRTENNHWLTGLFAGLAVWIRPDGLTLLGPMFFVMILNTTPTEKRWRNLLKSMMAFLPFIVGYFIFNKITAGSWLPNTFYAKQSEYAVLYQISLGKRLFQLFGQPWISAAVVTLPGLLFILVRALKTKDWQKSAMFLWATGYIVIYAVRLPVIYQHARYLMPAMPILYFLGLLGTFELLSTIKITESKVKLIRFGALVLMTSLSVGFWVLGITSYVSDLSIIHEEMVETSLWIRDNIPPNEVVAAHDIGALGYYGRHDILDLAGLISPDVIPFIRNEEKLLEFLQEEDVKYVMTFSDWYENLTDNTEMIYSSMGDAVLEAGGQHMAIYQFNWMDK